MSLVGTELVFDDQLDGNTTVYTSADFNAFIGQGDTFAFQVRATGVSGITSENFQVVFEHSLNGQQWEQHSVKTLASPTNTTFDFIEGFGDSPPHGSLGRLGFVFGASGPTARLRVWVSPRTA